MNSFLNEEMVLELFNSSQVCERGKEREKGELKDVVLRLNQRLLVICVFREF